MAIQREQLEADVLIVGAGPAGLACALHLANLIKQHNASGAKPELSAENIYVLEKGREIGAHQLSGAIMNPKALAELVPDFQKTAPLDTPVTDSAALIFTEKSSYRMPITPSPFNNSGNYVISLSKLVKWMGGLVESAGVNVFKEFGGAELIYEGDGIAGVITEDKGLDKNGKPKGRGDRLRNSSWRKRTWATSIRRATASGSRNFGTFSRARFNLATWRTRWAGRFRPRCTAVAGSMASATTAFRLDWLSRLSMKIRGSIPTQRSRRGRRI